MNTNCKSSHALQRPVHVSLGSYGRLSHIDAIQRVLSQPPVDPILGVLSSQHLQLCPQNHGRIDTDFATSLVQHYPKIQWRLHANVQLGQIQQRVDLCDWREQTAWFTTLTQMCQILKTPAYTAHAGQRDKASVKDVLRYALEAEQHMGIPVGIEGHYPIVANGANSTGSANRSNTAEDRWLFSNWQEYRQLLDSNVHYALDLSHLHILATHSKRIEWSLVQDLLNSPRCLEVHLSANDGLRDQHQPLTAEHVPWWWLLLPYIHHTAVIFSEGRVCH